MGSGASSRLPWVNSSTNSLGVILLSVRESQPRLRCVLECRHSAVTFYVRYCRDTFGGSHDRGVAVVLWLMILVEPNFSVVKQLERRIGNKEGEVCRSQTQENFLILDSYFIYFIQPDKQALTVMFAWFGYSAIE